MNFATRTATNMARAHRAELTLEKTASSLLRRAGLEAPGPIASAAPRTVHPLLDGGRSSPFPARRGQIE